MDPVSLAVGGASLLGSLFSGITGNKAAKNTNATNLQIARENNQLQQQIARENNQLQVDMMRENNKYSRDLALEMFNLENEYNTPAAQKQRLIEAGLNPATMYGSGGTVGNTGDIATPTSAGSTVSPSMPQFSTPTMQTPPTVLGALFGSIESVSRSLSNLSQSGLNKAQTNKISTLLNAELDKVLKEADNLSISNKVKEFGLELDKAFAVLERSVGVKKSTHEAHKLYQEGLLAVARQDTEKAEQLFKDAQTKLASSQSKQIDDLLPMLAQKEKETIQLLKEQKNTEKSKQAANYAGAEASLGSAELSREKSETERRLREYEVKLKKAIAGKEHESYAMLEAYIDEAFDAFGDDLETVGLNRKLLKEKVEAAKRDNDWGTVDKIKGLLDGFSFMLPGPPM